MVDLASLVVRLVADSSRYRTELDRAAAQLDGFAKIAKSAVGKVALAAAGAASAAAFAFAALAKSAIDTADEMNDLSKATGISTEALSQLKYAAEQSGTDLDGLTTGLRKFSKQAAEAASGSKSAREAFKLIGVSVTDAAGKLKPTEELLLDVADKFSQYKDGAAKAAAAQELFGKAGAALIPFLNEGRGGIEALKAEADRLGLTLSGKTAQAADDFNDRINKLQAKLTGATLQIVSKFLPGIAEMLTKFADLVAQGDQVNGFVENLANIFKFAAASGVRLYYFISNLGRQIGALAAIVVAAVKLNFTEASAIIDENLKDQVAAEKAMNDTLAVIYGERKEITEPGKNPKPDEADTRTDFPVTQQVVDELQEVDIKLKKIVIPEDYYKEMQEQTQTGLERAFSEFSKKKASLQVLKLDAQIDVETFNARLKELQTELLNTVSQGPVKEKVKEINEYQLQAARNTQDIIADTFQSLASGADVSAKSILKSFGNMIIQLAAQAAAANLAGKLFGTASTGQQSGGGGLVGTALGFFGGLLKRDSGGRGRAGQAYAIGTGAQPEMFIPDRAGTFVPAGAGGSVQNNFTIVAEQPLSRRTQLQIAAAAARGVERANRRNN